MKNILLLLFLANFQIGFCQTSATAVYKVEPITQHLLVNEDDDDLRSRAKINMLRSLELTADLEIIVKFNQDEYISYIDEGLPNDAINASDLRVAMAMLGPGVYYEKNNIKYHQIKTMGNNFIIKDDAPQKWTITKELKKIGNYTCYKAILDCAKCGFETIAWFSPEISATYGPVGNGDLPGLIIELNTRHLTIRMSKISFAKNPLNLKKPEKGKEITQAEFETMTNRVRSQARND